MLSLVGSIFGVLSGLSYIGIACSPADLYRPPHVLFVKLAFTAFFVAILFYLVAVLLTPNYPKVYAWTYLAFAVLLAIYIWLMFYGPSPSTTLGLAIQVAGQKVISYAAILTMFNQAYGAWQLGQTNRSGTLYIQG